MAGHSKWAQIKRQKAVKDAKKGAAFARSSREIIIAAKLGGPDPAGNFRLRTAIEHAKALAMPNENIARAIAKGSGAGGTDLLESIIYEGYGPGGVAILIECLSDNRNRTAGDIRSYFNKCEGNLGADGCVAWMFEELGMIRLDKIAALSGSISSEESLFESVIESGAIDFLSEQEQFIIHTRPTELNAVAQALSEKNLPIESVEMSRQAQNSVEVSNREQAKLLIKLLDLLESHDDVQAVCANFEMDDALLESILQEKAAMP